MVNWDNVSHADVVRAIHEYDRLGPEKFYAEHGFGPTPTYAKSVRSSKAPPI